MVHGFVRQAASTYTCHIVPHVYIMIKLSGSGSTAQSCSSEYHGLRKEQRSGSLEFACEVMVYAQCLVGIAGSVQAIMQRGLLIIRVLGIRQVIYKSMSVWNMNTKIIIAVVGRKYRAQNETK